MAKTAFMRGARAPAGASRNLKDYIDLSLTDDLRAAGFFDAMQRKYGMK
jgi:hypothetical protein